MSKIIDLTYPVKENMPVFPGDPGVKTTSTDYEGGYMVSNIIMGTHTGTHMDAHCHRTPGGESVDQIPLDKLIVKAFVLHLNLEKGDLITSQLLDQYKDKVESVNAILFDTGWSKYYGKEDFYRGFPGITEDAVEWFKDNGINLIGLDMPSVHPIKHAEIHDLIMESGIIIVETLGHLESIKSDYVDFYSIPLKLEGLDGSPVRAFVIEQ